ncbi:MHC class II transactivator isoform X8 [Meriones unguiculatus]|uniref:MHC class II transactivator isoform X8 n=1 Tax=Meriones unguiculatus TaxID=10047 RepID=UPI000B4F7F1F|nr:MHC class II transactivator isoform X8 [Meriones unguiculatus]
MNHFQAILAQVRTLLSSQQPRQVQALLDGLLEEELLSREYHCALLHEPDGEALARKISLTLLEKGDLDSAFLSWVCSRLQAPVVERDTSYWDHAGRSLCATMELGSLEGSYLELLNSDADPLHLYHLYDQMDLAGEEEIELCSEPDTDTINCDQFSKLLQDMEGDEETREAYANIAELDQYVFQDSQLEGLGKDLFKYIGAEEGCGRSTEVPGEAGRRPQKRRFPEEHTMDSKHGKLAEPSMVPMLTGSFLMGPANLSTMPFLPPASSNQEPAPSHTDLEGAAQMPVSSSSSSLNCLDLPAGHIQILTTLPQGLWQISGAGAGLSNVLIYHGEMPQVNQGLPSSSPTVPSLPKSPERPGSTSPFAPSAADLPNMPEPALTSRVNETEDTAPSLDQEDPESSNKLPKWPESVERFQHSLQDKYQLLPESLTGPLVAMELVRARLERGSNKSQERELATPDWTERQLAHGGLAEVLQVASDCRRPRETQVIAVLGKAGQGKSHWARTVTYAWARGQLPQYDFVFYVPCHYLDRSGHTYHLRDLLCPPSLQPLAMDDEVFGHIVRQPDRILLILDAFEELEAQEGLLHGPCGPLSSESCSLRGLLAGLFQRKLLRGCTLLLTARPRGRLAQSLSKADAIFEVPSFSIKQVQTYMRQYFENSGTAETQDKALGLLEGQPFLLTHSHSPALCKTMCQLSKTLLEQGTEAQLPCTLTGLYVGLLGPVARDSPPGALIELAKLAWELGRRHQSTLQETQFPSVEVKTWAVTQGLVQPALGTTEAQLAFSSFLLQCFLGAVWLAQCSEIKDKELPQYLALTPRKKRPYDNWLEGVPRFLTGLVFQPRAHCLGALVEPAVAAGADRKRKVLTRYLKRLQLGTLRAGRLLELLHCAHETQEPGIWEHVARQLPGHLSFLGTRLTPPDVHVLGRALESASQDFCLDLRQTGIEPSGLGNLVGLSCVTGFRASLSDTMVLWESLQQQGEAKLLQAAEEKFTIEPFKAKSPKDVEDLDSLVQTQRLRNPSDDAAKGLPAIQDLKTLEFSLGPILGPQAFPTLARILPAFSSLQHLDLDSLSENKIGDKGVSQLSATFPQLKALETLNLSQNSITDVGACELAEALPALAKSLLRLSLYNNCICDAGARSLAQVLPDMVSLRVMDVQFNKFTAAGAQQLASSLQKCPQVETLAMWTPTIPFGVQEHLQHLDARISLR